MKVLKLKISWTKVVVMLVYVCVLIMQLIMWPACQDDSSMSLMEELEQTDSEFNLNDPLPSNLLDPPLWSSDPKATWRCGPWRRDYTNLHREMLSGEQPASYLVYTTGSGFPPLIHGIPQAMRGIATVFLLALITDRVFLLDWRLPSGFEMVFIPRYIDWRYRAHFKDDDSDPSQSTLHHIHEIGANSWNQAWSGDQLFKFYTETDFNDYFSHDIEIIQSHSYDLTYAILRNKHHQEKLRSLGLDRTKCLLCCIWSYLFKNSQTFNRNLAILTKKQLGIAGNRDLVFLDLSLPVDHLSKTIQMAHAQEALKCTDKVVTVLQNPVCVVATNSYFLLEAVPTHYPRMNTNNGLFFTRERYLVELQREFNSSSRTSARKLSKNRVLIPKTERNALMNFFLSYYLQLNSTVLFTGVRSPFSENMAALRHFQRPSNTYVVRPGGKCKLERYTD